MHRYRSEIIVCLFLIITTLTVFWQVRNHDFVNYDDDIYVTENRHVRNGLTRESVIWAFTTIVCAQWHPLTLLSHMLDSQVFGLNAGAHHLTSVLFHMVNAILLFLVFKRMTGQLWQSGFVAALFALHPLHVESVAWVAERKDVLSTLFWILTMWAYVRYAESPGSGRYLLVLLFFALGLMAKSMLVTLPFVLLLLDFWPLGRFQFGHNGSQSQKTGGAGFQISAPLRLVCEKVPFFALAAVSCVVTFFAQQAGKAVQSLDVLPVNMRIANALVAYVSYIGKMIWPCHLSIFYPHPGMLPVWQVAGAVLLLLFISYMAIRSWRRQPYVAVGWLWYLGTLVPVIGLVQVGIQAMADRYAYVPSIGLSIIIAWGASDIAAKWQHGRTLLATSAGVILSALMVCTWIQVGHWRNSITLFTHAIEVTDNNYIAHNNLGKALVEQGKLKEAITHFTEALQIWPEYELAHNNLGVALAKQGKLDEAIGHFSRALWIRPDNVKAHNNLGFALTLQGKLDEAVAHFSKALQIKPDHAEAHYNLGNALARQGKVNEAIAHYKEALCISPDYSEAHNNLGVLLAGQGRFKEAATRFSEALCIKPDYEEAQKNLQLARRKMGSAAPPLDTDAER